MVRSFIAIPCQGKLRNRLIDAQKKISGLGRMKLVEPENIHMTLKFLGDVNRAQLDDISSALDFISDKKGFIISLKGVCAFPSQNYVRVIWVGVKEGRDKIVHIHEEIDNKLTLYGFKKDRRFHPHFTLARVNSVDKDNKANKGKIRDFLQDNSSIELGSFKVTEIDLIESRLSPSGPRYTILDSIAFK